MNIVSSKERKKKKIDLLKNKDKVCWEISRFDIYHDLEWSLEYLFILINIAIK